jgi:toxin secretion/phage lysis holin
MKDNILLAGCFGVLAYINNLNSTLLVVFFILMTIDYILGILKAIIKYEFKSAIMRNGIIRKACQTLVLAALLLTEVVAHEVGVKVPIGSIFIAIFCMYEITSIIENSNVLGIKIPDLIKNYIENINNKIK